MKDCWDVMTEPREFGDGPILPRHHAAIGRTLSKRSRCPHLVLVAALYWDEYDAVLVGGGLA